MSAIPGKSALLIGATGATGRHLLTELLSSQYYTRVGEFGRRVTPADKIPSIPGKDKLEQKTIDFEKLEDSGLKDGKWDVVFITLGTTRAIAKSAAVFEKIDREYVINAAKAAKSDDASRPQRLVYLSGLSANASSSFLYPRSKGLTELGLAELGYSDTIVFRPGFLAGAERDHSRLAESVAGVFTGLLSHIHSGIEIHVPVLAKAMSIAGRLGSSALPAVAEAQKAGTEGAPFTVISNKGALALAKTDA